MGGVILHHLCATMRKLAMLALGLILLGATSSHAQKVRNWMITIPLLDDGGGLRVPVKLWGSTNFFLLDTGASVTSLDNSFRDKLGPPVREAGGQQFYRAPDAAVGYMPLDLDTVLCSDLSVIRMVTGQPYDGVLGMDFLGRYKVHLDFDDQTLSILAAIGSEIKTNGWSVPLSVYRRRHFTIPARLNSNTVLDLLVDSGDNSTVSLNKEDWKKLFPSENAPNVHKLMIATTSLKENITESLVGRLGELEIGGKKYRDLVCPLSPHSAVASGLGLAFLRRHIVTFDFPNGLLYLRPGKRFETVEEHDMSGLHLLRKENKTFVHSVDRESPAALSGMERGDVIHGINGRETGSLTIHEIRETLRSKPGAAVSLLIERNEKPVTVEFKLKRVI
jgi:predicted aspartyl protease